jgi:hypothetical protein
MNVDAHSFDNNQGAMNSCFGHNKTRANHRLSFNAEPSLTFPSGEEGKAAAVDAAKTFDGCDFGESSGSLVPAGGSRSFKCITHANSSMKVKLMSGEADDGGFFLFSLLGDHASKRRRQGRGWTKAGQSNGLFPSLYFCVVPTKRRS